MADAVSPPPEVSPKIPDEALHAAARAYGLKRWTYVPSDYISPEYYERHIDRDADSTAAEPPFLAAAEILFAAGVAAGRTQAADYLDQRAQKIAASATSPADRGLAAGLRNVARELREDWRDAAAGLPLEGADHD